VSRSINYLILSTSPIGTDLHTFTNNGPAYDLPTVMTKFLHMGMPIYDVIKAVTSAPARAYNIADETGSLSEGMPGDVTVLKIEDCDVMLEDTVGQLRHVCRKISAKAVWREGTRFQTTCAKEWPSPLSQEKSLKQRVDQVVRD